MRALVFLLLTMLAMPAFAQTWTGVPRVVDGDSLEIGIANLRLIGTDAPEWNQSCYRANGTVWACGAEASYELARFIGSRSVTCVQVSYDRRWNRPLLRCRVGDTDIAGAMVYSGYALVYLTGDYQGYENEARKAGRGIWQGRFDRPENWRWAHRHR